MYQTIVQAVLAHGQSQPDKLAVIFKKEQVNYAQLVVKTRQMAYQLQKQFDVHKGDFVMISGVSKPDYVVAYLACQYLGAVSIPIDKSAKVENILDVYRYAGPKVLLTDNKLEAEDVIKCSLKTLYAQLDELSADGVWESLAYEVPQDTDLAEVLFTTGTTGKPKGTMLTIGNIYASTHNTWKGVGMQTDERVLVPLPLNHSVGMRELRTIMYIGATLVLQNGFTFAKELENNIKTFDCTALVSVPASMEMVYRQMQEQFADIMGVLRYIEFGAGSLSYDMKRKLSKILPTTTIYNTWGSTETGGAIFLNVTEHPDKLTSLGIPAEGIELKVVNADGETIEARDINTAGRMVLRGPMQMVGYYHMPEATAATLVDGWLYTNDMVYTDADGYVYMLGRADDIINVGGEKVSPIEVENIASEQDGVRDCACIGVEDPDGILGQVPVLFVVPEGNRYQEEELIRFLASKMEKYKMPKQYVLVGELPRNRMKKLNRKALVEMWKNGGGEDLMNETVRTLMSRRSIRDFTDQEIPKSLLESILQCGYYAPSGHNMQTWRFTVIRNQDVIARLKETVAAAAKDNKVHFYGFNNPNTVILVSNDRRNPDGIQDSSCAAENVMLAAHSYGLGSAWINAMHTICDVPQVRELLDELEIPATHIVWSTLVMGYPAKDGTLLAKKTNVIKWVE